VRRVGRPEVIEGQIALVALLLRRRFVDGGRERIVRQPTVDFGVGAAYRA
jgi:hypothetical protein